MTQARSTRDIIIHTERPQEAADFYQRVLGLQVFQREPMIGLETGAFRLFIDKARALGPVLEFLVDDIEAVRGELLAAGCVIVEENPAVPRLYIRDPFGLVFNIDRRRG